MSSEITLFDLPTRGSEPRCWSLNPWKIRLVLSLKGLPYRTEWVEYPDIKPLFQSYGIPPNPPVVNTTEYSIPTVRMADGSYVMDSIAIARAIEKLQPEPSLHLEDIPVLRRSIDAIELIRSGLNAILMPRVPEMLLNPSSAEYFERTRSKRLGMPLPELAKSPQAGEAAWTTAKPGFDEVIALLREHPDGPFVLGKEVGFADFILAGFWRFTEQLDRDGDVFPRIMGIDESISKHNEACRVWMDRDQW